MKVILVVPYLLNSGLKIVNRTAKCRIVKVFFKYFAIRFVIVNPKVRTLNPNRAAWIVMQPGFADGYILRKRITSYISIYIYVYVYIYIHICMDMYVCIYKYIYACMYVYVYQHVHRHMYYK